MFATAIHVVASRVSFLGLGMVLVACLEALPDPTVVEDLRVLAVRAEPPEVAAGTEVSLDALVVDPDGNPVSYRWHACIMPPRNQGFFGGGGQTSTSGGNGAPLDSDEDGSSCRLKFERGRPFSYELGTNPTATFTVPADLLDDDTALQLAFGLPADLEIPPLVRVGFLGISGLNVTIELTVSNGTREIVTRKWLNVSTESPVPGNDRNVNPTDVALIVLPGGSEDVAPTIAPPPTDGRCFAEGSVVVNATGAYRLEPVNFPPNPAEYLVLLAGSTTGEPFEVQPRTETYFYSFYATGGKLAKETSRRPGQPSNTWKLDALQAGEVDFWMVVRDGRGGVTWCSDTVTLE